MSQSYNFNRDTVNNFRGRSIDPAGFFAWQKDDMYKSTYAKFHSSVLLIWFFRILFNLKTLLFLAMGDSFLELKQITFTQRVLQILPNNLLVMINWVKTYSDWLQQDLMSIKKFLLTILNLDLQANMEKVPSRNLIQIGV